MAPELWEAAVRRVRLESQDVSADLCRVQHEHAALAETLAERRRDVQRLREELAVEDAETEILVKKIATAKAMHARLRTEARQT